MTRVLIADDDDLMRAGLIELLSSDATIEIVGEAATGCEAVERARALAPDVVLMDVRMPDLDGIAATRQLARVAPAVKVLILTTFEQDDYVFDGLRAGASGFLLKRTRPEELIAGVHAVAAGDSLLSPSVTRRVIDRVAQQPTPNLADHAKLDQLTAREREVLELVARGLSNPVQPGDCRSARRRGVHDQDARQADPRQARASRPDPSGDLRLRERPDPTGRPRRQEWHRPWRHALMVRSEARIPTDSAERYLKQLCNHAVHMGARSEWTPPDGLVEFPHGGTCHLTATPDELILTVEAPTPDQLATIQTILSADFQRFGQRHGMQVTWSS